MLTVRLIPCLDVQDGRVVKGVRFRDLRVAGDPAELAGRYFREGADELCLLDVSATFEKRGTVLDTVRRVAERIAIPLTVGGGVASLPVMTALLRAGADKVALNSAAVTDPALLGRAARRFGRQCVVVSIDALAWERGWRVTTTGGRHVTDLDAVAWAVEAERRGAGEILLNSIDRDGTGDGYDLDLLRAITGRVAIPVIASGGAGGPEQMRAALGEGNADAVLVASILHDGRFSIGELKRALRQQGVNVR